VGPIGPILFKETKPCTSLPNFGARVVPDMGDSDNARHDDGARVVPDMENSDRPVQDMENSARVMPDMGEVPVQCQTWGMVPM